MKHSKIITNWKKDKTKNVKPSDWNIPSIIKSPFDRWAEVLYYGDHIIVKGGKNFSDCFLYDNDQLYIHRTINKIPLTPPYTYRDKKWILTASCKGVSK